MVGMLSKTTITFPIIGDVKTNVAESYNNLFEAHSGLSALKGTIL
jgi:alkyl hydroperoxide reductase subunit AhpC